MYDIKNKYKFCLEILSEYREDIYNRVMLCMYCNYCE